MKSDWFLANIDGWQKKHQPEAGVILFGSNDLGGLLPPEYTENMAAGIRRMLQDGTVPLLTTVPPASGRDVWCPHYYMACSIIARHFQIPVIDYYGEIMKRRPEDWNGALPKFAQDQVKPDGRKDEYAVKTLISADGVHPSNRAEYGKDFGPEALSNNGFNLRDYMTLRKYGEVIRKVFQAE
jgi:lysophospholipase L1-like esterase